MTGVTAIRVDDEKNVVDYSTDRLDSNLAIFATIIRPLQCGTQEDARGIFKAEAAFVAVKSTAALQPALVLAPLIEVEVKWISMQLVCFVLRGELTLLLVPLSQSDSGATAVLLNELNPG
jgi:hypothetical protein